MTIRADMAKSVTEVRKICRGLVVVTDAHWQEAANAVGEDKKKQESYLKSEASRGVMDGCKDTCDFGASSSLAYNAEGVATMTSMCNRDPRLRY
ncbi:MAG TPA: hypothetical protein VIV11_31305 [Kofleriaceae bacterium]